jgi:CheY-like chemotaxis protein
MTVLICDDSRMARRQMARSLPPHWDIDLAFAENGAQAVELVRQGKGDLLFLDLNMPEMNGYEVLDIIRSEDLPTMALVVSGDIQPEARARVMAKGALDFVKKPVSPELVLEVLSRYGIYDAQLPDFSEVPPRLRDNVAAPGFNETLREVVNIAMGQAGSHLSELLNTFIRLPVPEVILCPYQDIVKHLGYADDKALSAVSHGFSGNGVAGEGIILISTDKLSELQFLVGVDLPSQSNTNAAILTDLSELLVGACLKGISQQLDLEFNHSYPVVLGHRLSCAELLDCKGSSREVLALNITYHLQHPAVECHLLLIMTEDSIPSLATRIALITDADAEAAA